MEQKTKVKNLLLAGVLCCGFATSAWAQKVTLDFKDVKVEKVLSAIKKQTKMGLVFSDQTVDVNRIVSLHLKDAELEEALAKLLEGTGVSYEIRNNKIYLVEKQGGQSVNQQKIKKVNGLVVDAKGEPIIGANIMVKGTTNGVITDLDGKFELTDLPANSTLAISYIGYLSQNIKVGSQRQLKIVLREDTKTLEEVVVVGYTSQKKGLLAGSVETTKFSDEMAQIPMTSAGDALIGKMAGVNISTPNGEPGSQASVSVRTGTTWNSSPMLYVIDGAVRDARTFQNLSPNEIETVSVLKDAASAAVYGARSDAGVILITTKSGKRGKAKVNYTANYSADFATQEVELTNLYQTGLMVNQMYKNFGLTAPTGTGWSEEELAWAKALPGQGYNTLDEVWHTPYVMNHSLSVSGGGDKIKYFGAANYYVRNGFMASNEYRKLNLRLNITADITDDLQLFASISNTNTKKDSSPTEGTGATYLKSRVSFNYMPCRTPDGRYVGDGWAYGNPAAAAEGASGYNRDKDMNPQVNFSLTYKLPWVKGLSLKAAYMGSWRTTHGKSYRKATDFWYPNKSGDNNHIIDVTNPTSSYKTSEMSYVYADGEWITNEQMNFQAAYDNHFGDHHVYGSFVYEASSSNYASVWGQRNKFPLYQHDQFWAASSSHDDMSAGGGPDTSSGRASYVLVGGYDFANKYIFSFSMRYDGSMNFAPDQRWGLFPAASAAWVMSEENFLKDNETIDFLKLRGSVALTGNDAVGGWQWQTSYASGGSYMFGENLSKLNGLKYGSLVNEDLTWEKSLGINVGVDFKLFKHMSGSLEYWHKKTFDILGNRQNTLPTTFSRTMPAENYGEVKAQGFDFSIGWEDRTGEVDWHANMNLSYGWNEVVKKDYSDGLLDWEIPVGKSTSYKAAYSAYIIRNEQQLEEFKKNNPDYGTGPTGGLPIQLGSLVYVDRNKDGAIDRYDKTVLYDNTNPVYLGLNLGAKWKGFSIDATFTGKFHNFKQFNALGDYYEGSLQVFNTEWLTDSWTPENPDASLPMMAPRDYRTYSWGDTDFWWKKANYIRLSNLNIGYTFDFKQPLGGAIESVKLFATGTNLFYISGFKHWDPELSPGWSGVGYPVMRTLGGGISVNF